MARARSAYWSEFRRAAMDTHLAREVQGFQVIEALALIQIPVRWKQRRQIRRGGEVVGTVWREYGGVAEYTPGQVLHPEWRAASEWEVEEWQGLPDEQLGALGVFRQNGRYSIQIVEKIKDLPAAIRQRGRHIPASKIFRPGRSFTLAGDAERLTRYARQLTSLVDRLLQEARPNSQVMEQGSRELSEISEEVGRRRTTLLRHAREEIDLAIQGTFWQVTAHASQALADLLGERMRDYGIAVSSVELALTLHNLMADIERRFRNGYHDLGQRGQELQGMIGPGQTVAAGDLSRIAQAAHRIWTELNEQVPRFNPYYQRLQGQEFQRLSRILRYAQAGRSGTVYNFINGATAKLEAVAIGEQPTRDELSRQRGSLL